MEWGRRVIEEWEKRRRAGLGEGREEALQTTSDRMWMSFCFTIFLFEMICYGKRRRNEL